MPKSYDLGIFDIRQLKSIQRMRGRHMFRRLSAKLLYLAVFVSNMICIVAFLTEPEAYTGSYQVRGALGAVAAIQGYGVTFAMWNVTYPFFILGRKDNKALGMAIIVQQVVGLIGELYIRRGLSADCAILAESITRFVWFDAGGLVLLVAGYILMFAGRKNSDT